MENIKENFTKEEIYVIRNAIFERWTHFSKKVHDTDMFIVEHGDDDDFSLRYKRKLKRYEENEKILRKFYKNIDDIYCSYPLFDGGAENGKK